MYDTTEIIKRLSQAQKESGISYAALEKKTGIGHSTLQRYFTGTSKKVSFNDLVKICNALGVDPAEIMGWSGDAKVDGDLSAMFEAFRQLSPSEMQRVLDFVRGIISTHEQ